MKFKVSIAEETSYGVIIDTDIMIPNNPSVWIRWLDNDYDMYDEEKVKDFVIDILSSEGLDFNGVSDPIDKEIGYWTVEDIRRV